MKGTVYAMARAAMLVACVVLLLCPLSALPCASGVQEAFAVDRGDYAEKFMESRPGTWGSEILDPVDPIDDGKSFKETNIASASNSLVESAKTLILNIIVMIFAIVMPLLVLRIGVRGAIEMVGRKSLGESGQMSEGWNGNIPKFFWTAEERANKVTSPNWIFPMLKDTFKYILIALGAQAILGAILLVLVLFFGAATPPPAPTP